MSEVFDWTVRMGPQSPLAQPEIPMYSYERPAWIVWNAIAKTLHERGWSEPQIVEWLQSKQPRWALDSDLGDALVTAARDFAATIRP